MTACALERQLLELINSPKTSDSVSNFIEVLSQSKVDPNYSFITKYAEIQGCYGKPLLFLAVSHNRDDIVEYLLKLGASPNCSRNPFAFESQDDDPFKRTALFESLSLPSATIFNVTKPIDLCFH